MLNRMMLTATVVVDRFSRLGEMVADHFRKLSDDRFSELFALGAAELRERATVLESQLAHCTASRDRFRQVCQRIASRAATVAVAAAGEAGSSSSNSVPMMG